MEYNETLQMCDRILEIFTAEKPAGENAGGINHILGIQNRTAEAGIALAALQRLEDDKYLVLYGNHNDLYKIGSHTLGFKKDGGYQKLVEKETRKEELKAALEDLGFKTNQSVIDTGDSVQKLNKLLRPTTKAQVLISVVTVIVAALAAWVSWLGYQNTKTNDGLELRQKSLETEVQKMKENIDKIQPIADSLSAHLKDSIRHK